MVYCYFPVKQYLVGRVMLRYIGCVYLTEYGRFPRSMTSFGERSNCEVAVQFAAKYPFDWLTS